MTLLRAWWSRLDGLQRTTPAKIGLSVFALVVVGSVFGYLWSASASANARFNGVVEVLAQANNLEKNEIAVRLLEKGEVEADGVVYGNERFAEYAETLFDEETGAMIYLATLAELLISQDIPQWLPTTLIYRPDFVLWLAAGILCWLLLVIWAEIALQVAVGVLATLLACGVLAFFGERWGFEYAPLVLAISGIGLLVITFLLLIRVLLYILGFLASPGPRPGRHGSPGTLVQICSVAQVLIRESVRLRISLAFIVFMLVGLPLIPLWIDSSEPLRYQIQNFLSDSMNLVYVLAACMTLVLSCATVSFEIRDRQIWQLMTKPIGKLQYMLGKWCGLILLNLVLLLIGGISIFTFNEYLRTRPSTDIGDALTLNDEVLTARVGVLPVFQNLSPEELRRRVDTEIDNNSILKDEIATGEKRMDDVRRQLARQKRREFLDQQRSIPPTKIEDGAELDARTYFFPGLAEAREEGANVTLRFEFHIGRSESTDKYPVVFNFPDVEQQVEQFYVPAQWHSLLVPADWIGEDGVLRLQILNGGYSRSPSDATLLFFPSGATLFFDPDGMEVLWQASTFEWNFLRAMLVNWVKLAFLAMLGVAAATFLSFPVAVMLAFTVFVGGSLAPFIAMSVDQFRVDREMTWILQAAQWCIIAIARSAEWLLRPFGAASPNSLVVEGRLVPWSGVFRDFLQIGILWSGMVFFLGWFIFRRRELATYSGHG
ncbi:MAG: hypothetical protein MK085_03015 [Phycisphaerales bacterium]|nr:hypothetical protein [Phycisphaerales bacterium]